MSERGRRSPSGHYVSELAEVIDEFSEEIGPDRFCQGIQMYVEADGQVKADVALGTDGLGRGNEVDTIYALYCATKPLVPLAIASLVDAGQLEVDANVGDMISRPCSQGVGRLKVAELLSHTAGVHQMSSVLALFHPAEMRDEMVTQTDPPEGWRPGIDAGYSEFAAWHLLGMVIESASGQEPRRFIRDVLLDPLELTGQLFVEMSTEEFHENLERIGVNSDTREGGCIPLLVERTHNFCTRMDLGSGGKGTARTLGRLYSALGKLWHDESSPLGISTETLKYFTRAHRQRTFDVVLKRECAMGLGFMVQLEDHRFGPGTSAEAFGHSAAAGSTWAFADPRDKLAMGVVCNTFFETEADSAYQHRQWINKRILGALQYW